MKTLSKKDLIIAIFLQGLGGFCSLIAITWLGKQFGAQSQGLFSSYKSMIDFTNTIAFLGMPQALYVAVQSNSMKYKTATTISNSISVLSILVAIIMCYSKSSSLIEPTANSALNGVVLGYFLFSISVALSVQYSFNRVFLLLHTTRKHLFNIVSSVPAFLLLAIVGHHQFTNQTPNLMSLGIAFAITWGISFIISQIYMKQVELSYFAQKSTSLSIAPDTSLDSRHSLFFWFRQGMYTWIQSMVIWACFLALQKIASEVNGLKSVGLMAFAYTIGQAVLIPINYTAPLLLRSKLISAHKNNSYGLKILGIPPFFLLMCAGMVYCASFIVGSDYHMGADYIELNTCLFWIILASAAESLLRLIAIDMQAKKTTWKSALSEFIRLSLLGLFYISAYSYSIKYTVTSICILWFFITVISAIVLIALTKIKSVNHT